MDAVSGAASDLPVMDREHIDRSTVAGSRRSPCLPCNLRPVLRFVISIELKPASEAYLDFGCRAESIALPASNFRLDLLAAVADFLDRLLHLPFRHALLFGLVAYFVLLAAGDSRPILGPAAR